MSRLVERVQVEGLDVVSAPDASAAAREQARDQVLEVAKRAALEFEAWKKAQENKPESPPRSLP